LFDAIKGEIVFLIYSQSVVGIWKSH
jgi:hypothetical protein